jgi:hypothetical protein
MRHHNRKAPRAGGLILNKILISDLETRLCPSGISGWAPAVSRAEKKTTLKTADYDNDNRSAPPH